MDGFCFHDLMIDTHLHILLLVGNELHSSHHSQYTVAHFFVTPHLTSAANRDTCTHSAPYKQRRKRTLVRTKTPLMSC
jgi:hypothetical protein